MLSTGWLSVCRSPRYPAGLGTSRSRPQSTSTVTWCQKPAAVHVTRWTKRSPRRLCTRCAPGDLESCCAAGQRHGRRASRPVGRVLCTRVSGPAAIHLGLPLPAASCGLPTSIRRAALKRSRRLCGPWDAEPFLTLLRVGFTEPPQSPAALVVSYTTVSPLPPDAVRRRSVFCGTFPRVTPGRRYRPPCPVEPGPSSTLPGNQAGAATARPARPPLRQG
jgi:hypothetical protein